MKTTAPALPLAPATYADVLALARAATVVSWYRDGKHLSLIHDDIAGDRRTCVDVRFESEKCGSVEVRTLCGYDAKANRWCAYCGPAGTRALPDRRGKVAVDAFIREAAQKLTGWPNPASFALYA